MAGDAADTCEHRQLSQHSPITRFGLRYLASLVSGCMLLHSGGLLVATAAVVPSLPADAAAMRVRLLACQVAVKCVSVRDETELLNFLREVECLAALRHPNVVPFLGAVLQVGHAHAPVTTVLLQPKECGHRQTDRQTQHLIVTLLICILGVPVPYSRVSTQCPLQWYC